MEPWTTELVVVRKGSYTAGERRSISRDIERGLRTRVRQGVTVRSADWDASDGPLREPARHVVRARAFDAVAVEQPVFSHFTSAVLLGLPVMDAPLDRVHVAEPSGRRRGLDGVLTHALPLEPEAVREFRGLLVTGMARTVVDVAGLAPSSPASSPLTAPCSEGCRKRCSTKRSLADWAVEARRPAAAGPPVSGSPARGGGRDCRSGTGYCTGVDVVHCVFSQASRVRRKVDIAST
jgi:hypothetical protein